MVFALDKDTQMEALGRSFPTEYLARIEGVALCFNHDVMTGRNLSNIDLTARLNKLLISLKAETGGDVDYRSLVNFIGYRIKKEIKVIAIQREIAKFFSLDKYAPNNLRAWQERVQVGEDENGGLTDKLLLLSFPSFPYTRVYSREGENMLMQRAIWRDFRLESHPSGISHLKIPTPPKIETEERYPFDRDMRRLALSALEKQDRTLILVNSAFELPENIKFDTLSRAYSIVLTTFGCSYKDGKRVE